MCALAALAAGWVHADGLSHLDYTLRTWRLEDGLPRQTIGALIQTRDRYLWLGVDEGAIRFDGVHFELS